MSILSSTKSGVKCTTLTLEDFKNHGFKGNPGDSVLTKTRNGKTINLYKQNVRKMSGDWYGSDVSEIYNYQCSINGKIYNIPITNLYSLNLIEEIFVTTKIKKLIKLRKKLYKHVFNHHAPTKAERIKAERIIREKEFFDALLELI